MLALQCSGFSLTAKCIKAVHGKLLGNSNFYNNIGIFLASISGEVSWKIAREKQIREKQIAPSVLADATTGFCRRNLRKNSIMITRHFQDLGCACDWLKISFDQSEALPRSGKWRVNSMEFLCLFLRRHFAGWRRRIMSAVFSDYIIPSIHHGSRTISAQEIASYCTIYTFLCSCGLP